MKAERVACYRQDIIETITRALHGWLAGDDLDGDQVRAAVDRILKDALAEEHDPARATSAIAHLRMVRDELELAGRLPGEFVTITRQQLDQVLNDLGVVARLIREAENQIPA